MASLSSSRYRAFPNSFTESVAAVPAVAADLSTTDSLIWQVMVCNTTAGAITFTLKDRQGTPRNVLSAVSIAGNTTYIISWPEGQFFDNGVNWVASGAGLEASIVGGYKNA